MRASRRLRLFVVAVMLATAICVRAQNASDAAIEQVLQQQVSAWNRGDLDDFMQGYKDSPDTTFIGKSVEHGYAPILARYRKTYSSKDAMGTLQFSGIAVRNLGAEYAVATGRFHLARGIAGGGDASGIFSLVWEKTAAGWKIILDTSTTP